MVGILTVLRLVHIFGGVFWAGTSIALTVFIEPAIKAAGPAGNAFNERLMAHTRLQLAMILSSLGTALSGLVLYWLVSGGDPVAYLGTGMGMGFTLGSIAGMAEFVMGFAVMAPTAAKIGALGQVMQTAGGPPTSIQLAQMGTLQARLDRGGKYSAVLLGIAVVGMAVARYL